MKTSAGMVRSRQRRRPGGRRCKADRKREAGASPELLQELPATSPARSRNGWRSDKDGLVRREASLQPRKLDLLSPPHAARLLLDARTHIELQPRKRQDAAPRRRLVEEVRRFPAQRFQPCLSKQSVLQFFTFVAGTVSRRSRADDQ